jgi:2-oxoglutarate ferredoxin oxidoreductase subunit alpha
MSQSQELHNVIIRFAGDSGDGMQLTGGQFTMTSAVVGNDISTFPDFPAEIRAPAGSLPGVSGFQLHFSDYDIRTAGDVPHVLVAMNPAALKVHIEDLEKGGMIIVNEDAFTDPNLRKAQYDSNPLEDGSLDSYQVVKIGITKLNREALKDIDLNTKEIDRSKNFFALGLMYWLYDRPMEPTENWIEKKFKKSPNIIEANKKALHAGYNYGDTCELFPNTYHVPEAQLPEGQYRQVTGNKALALGLAAAAQLSGKNMFYGSYPITPASDILHELSNYKHFNITTFQAEDEIAAVCSAIGASFAGSIGVTGTSGPGVALKGEALGLAVMTELPLVVVNVQRAGPSTGMPTKVEQADLLQALYGRHGESPLCVIAPMTPGDCFDAAIEATRIATRYMVPVMILSDNTLANGAEPWIIPDIDSYKAFPCNHLTEVNGFEPYKRNEETLARPWAIPGTKGLEHRIGGLEKQENTGNVSYNPENHQRMTDLRQEKVDRIANELPDTTVYGPEQGDVLVVGWGSTFGAIMSACEQLRADGVSVANTHVRYISPLPKDLGDILKRYKKVLIPELNMGQLSKVLRAEYLVDAKPLNKVQGRPLYIQEIKDAVQQLLQTS